jgi:hypothetical protein
VKFPCTECGACCTRIQPSWNGYAEFAKNNWILPDGSCVNYDRATRRCRIYETRPAVCNVVKEYSIVNPPISLEQWFDVVEVFCDEAHEREYGCKRERGEPCSHKK